MAEAHLLQPRTIFHLVLGPKGLWPCSYRKESARCHWQCDRFCHSLPRSYCIRQGSDGHGFHDHVCTPASICCRFSCTCWRDLFLWVSLPSKSPREQIPCGEALSVLEALWLWGEKNKFGPKSVCVLYQKIRGRIVLFIMMSSLWLLLVRELLFIGSFWWLDILKWSSR